MLLITVTSVYLIAVVADYFLHLSIYSNVRESQKIITKKKQTEDRPLFKKAYAPKGTHLSPIGYKVVANDIKKVLKELN